MYKGKWDLKILIYSAVVDCLSKIDCLKQLLLQFIKLTDAHLLLKLNMKKKKKNNTRRKERGDRRRKERGRSIGKGGREKERREENNRLTS